MLFAILLLQAAPLAPTTVPDPELAEMRGGFLLPNGVDVSISVDTRTAVDGAIVLRTIFRVDQGAPTVTAYTPKPGETVVEGRSNTPVGAVQGMAAPTVTYDSRSGVRITQATTMPVAAAVTVGRAAAGDAIPDGLEVAPTGSVTEAVRGNVRTVELAREDLTITHFAGGAIGSAIANMGSDRTIDTQTSISLDLRNAGPEVIGSAMLRVEGVALEAARSRF